MADSPLCQDQGAAGGQMAPLQGQTPAAMPGTVTSPNVNYSDTEALMRQRQGQRGVQTTNFPPERLTEFQRFVASTTGQVLPIFAANLFRTAPSTFAPLDMTPVPSDYVIGPDDELRIRVWGQVNIQSNLRVDRSGEVYLPQVGPVHVAGLPYSELNSHLRSAIGRVYRNFDLTADVGQIRAIQVYVSGQAQQPGMYTISSLSTLVDAIFASGGPTVQGSLRAIEVRRNGTAVTTFDLYQLLIHGDKSKDVKLQSGDVIYFPPVGSMVAMTGSIRRPAIYELKADETLNELLGDAGGASTVASESRISIERIDAHKDRQAMEVGYDQAGLATPLADGDLVRVYAIVPKYQKTVTVRGNLANPGRFAWHEGMHVSELIPDQESLVTRDYWWKRAQLGMPEPEFEPMLENDNLQQPRGNEPVTVNRSGLTRLQAQTYGATGQATSGLSQTQSLRGQAGMATPPVNLNQQSAAAFLQQDNLAQQDGTALGQQDGLSGQQAGLFGQQDGQSGQQLSAEQRASNSSLAEQQTNSGALSQWTGKRNRVGKLSPEIDWNYAVVERLETETLKTRLIPFDLGRLVLQHDASQDVELQPGDVVTIFSEADIRIPLGEQTKFVHLEGEFAHSGVYTVKPGETLRTLVERAGGITQNAYLYGSEFRRESTRAIQQARLDEYVQNLGVRIQHSNLALAAASQASQSMIAGQQAQSSERLLLDRLRLIRATGRIVLEFKPDSSGLASIPDLPLEDGDRFIIPSVPASVNVVGSVYDQNSFLYEPQKKVGNYLQQAGGPTKDADKDRAYVIRADGEVVSYLTTKVLWGNDFPNLPMHPGDTIVMPEKTFKPSALRGALDYSQLFSQLALGAASVAYMPIP
ncbi:MAG: SLBB domain-containing protein [Terracidiphilus sp.]